jgi:hypothetical protein
MANNQEQQGPPRRPQSRFLAREITALGMAIDEVHQELGTAGQATERTRAQLQSQLSTVIFQLRQWRDETQVEYQQATPFDGGPDQLLQMMLDGEMRQSQPKGQHGQGPTTTKTAAKIELSTLYESAADIMDLCNDLGLAAEIDDGSGTIIAAPIGEKSDELPAPVRGPDAEDDPEGPQ